ncbi:MAG: MAPEG family protein [Alphaproteobacteria bacterium]|nr:MAPEG family protein [Alphaproteobacteria bacterium]MBU0793907.1 MAPEG family protein [Alphaproteobacteria bacterium]MBU0876283.1 MAPEG family protein [Alphaproteobacteria bacterium]MBU1768208.1 MAPEG family protein [Alphaproteobacteria bacterium]
MSVNLLVPVFALVLWSLVMLFWMVALRLPALAKLKIPPEQARGGRGQDLDRLLPREINWPAHNYVHLMEQPTIFYAAVVGLALLGQGTMLNVALAWGYVAIRIVHSIWQAKVNTIPVRVSLFFLSTILLAVLAVNGLLAALRLSA